MGTKNIFGAMLNQKSIQAPQIKAGAVKIQKPPGIGQFAYLSQGNTLFRHPMENRGKDVSGSVWARMLGTKGMNNV